MNGPRLFPFLTISQRYGNEGAEYILTHLDSGQQRSVFDGEDLYWTIANGIEALFAGVAAGYDDGNAV